MSQCIGTSYFPMLCIGASSRTVSPVKPSFSQWTSTSASAYTCTPYCWQATASRTTNSLRPFFVPPVETSPNRRRERWWTLKFRPSTTVLVTRKCIFLLSFCSLTFSLGFRMKLPGSVYEWHWYPMDFKWIAEWHKFENFLWFSVFISSLILL